MARTNGELHGEDTVKLPVINISENTVEAGRQMIDAAARHGFLYIDTRGTDFTPEIVERQFELSKCFFSSPKAEKAACTIGPDNRGWTGMHSETLDPAHQKRGDFKEAFNLGEFLNEHPQQPIPVSLQDHEAELLDFEVRCRKTCHQILRLLALGLEIPDPEWFSSRHKTPSGCTLRLLHYPALSKDTDYQPEVDIRAGAHSDYGSITLLFQRPSQPGLEILTTNNHRSPSPSMSPSSTSNRSPSQTWSPVPVVPPGYTPETSPNHPSTPFLPPILLNIGDLLSYWTNGLLKSTIHRVIFPYPEAPPGSQRRQQQEHQQDNNRKRDRNVDDMNGAPSAANTSSAYSLDRYSIAYFCHPTDSTALEAVPSSLIPAIHTDDQVGYGGGADTGTGAGEAGGGYVERTRKVLTAKEHLVRRLEATYGFKHA